MTRHSIYEKARAERIAEAFRRRNPGKVPLRAVMLRPKRKQPRKQKEDTHDSKYRQIVSAVKTDPLFQRWS